MEILCDPGGSTMKKTFQLLSIAIAVISVFAGISPAAAAGPSLIAPATISGNPSMGQVLSAGGFKFSTLTSTSNKYFYQWYSCANAIATSSSSVPSGCTTISGASNSRFVLTSKQVGKAIVVSVLAKDTTGGTTTFSTSTGLVSGPPVKPSTSSIPVLTGIAKAGSELSVSGFSFTGQPSPVISHRWFSCISRAITPSVNLGSSCALIPNANSSTFTPESTLVGRFIVASVTAVNSAGTVTTNTASSLAVAAQDFTAPEIEAGPSVDLRVDGTPVVGSVLVADEGSWTGYPVPSQTTAIWYRCENQVATYSLSQPEGCMAISGSQNSSVYVITSADMGKYLLVEIVSRNVAGTVRAWSSSTGINTGIPEVTTDPFISGGTSPRVGDELIAGDGVWIGAPEPTFDKNWYRCDLPQSARSTLGSACEEIPNAVDNRYTISGQDAGSFLIWGITATNSGGSAFRSSGSSGVIQGIGQTESDLQINGLVKVGSTVEVAVPAWKAYPSVSLTYEWLICQTVASDFGFSRPLGCDALGTTKVITLTSTARGKYLVAVVTASNSSGSKIQTVSSQSPVLSAPSVNLPPVISGTSGVGSVLSVSNGSWAASPEPTNYSYRWFRCNSPVSPNSAALPTCSVIQNQSSSTYTLIDDDLSQYVTAEVTASNSVGSAISSAGQSSSVRSLPRPTFVPAISGTNTIENTLTLAPGAWTGNPNPTISYSWFRCDSSVESGLNTVPGDCVEIKDQVTYSYCSRYYNYYSYGPCRNWSTAVRFDPINRLTYVLSAVDAGKYVVARVTASNSGGTVNVITESLGATGRPVGLSSSPYLSGITAVGRDLTLSTGSWTGFPAPELAIQWFRCTSAVSQSSVGSLDGCAEISGATTSTYTISAEDFGKFITARVAASNSLGSVNAWAAQSSDVKIAPAVTANPFISGTALVGQTMTLTQGTWTGTPTPTISVQWYRCDSEVSEAANVVPAGCTEIREALTQRVCNGSYWNGCFSYITVTTNTMVSINRLTYVLSAVDAGKYVVARVTASNSGGTVNVITESLGATGRPVGLSSSPYLSGITAVGRDLTLSTGSWTGFPAPELAIQWFRCTSAVSQSSVGSLDGCAEISGATTSTYTISAEDFGKFITARVAASNSLGSVNAWAAQSSDVKIAPAVTANPFISGTALVGQTMTLTQGTWTGTPTPTISVQWYRCDSEVSEAANVVPAGCNVISETTTNRVNRPRCYTYSYLYRCVDNWIETQSTWYARGVTYLARNADTGKFVSAFVTATNQVGSATIFSESMGRVNRLIENVSVPLLSGNLRADQVLTISNGSWVGFPSPTFNYSWFRCSAQVGQSSLESSGCVIIAGVSSNSYRTVSDDIGKYITARVTATNSEGSLSSWANQYSQVLDAPRLTAGATFAGSSLVGSTLTLNRGTWTGTPTPSFSYQWLRCSNQVPAAQNTPGECTPISRTQTLITTACAVTWYYNRATRTYVCSRYATTTQTTFATGETYVPSDADAGMHITVRVTAENTAGTSISLAESRQIRKPATLQSSPSTSQGVLVGQSMSANIGTWLGYPAPTNNIAWFRCALPVAANITSQALEGQCTAIEGATGLTYTPVESDKGLYLTFRVTSQNDLATVYAWAPQSGIVRIAPTAISSAAITGSTTVGSVLAATSGTWAGFPTPTIVTSWWRCDVNANLTNFNSSSPSAYVSQFGCSQVAVNLLAYTLTNLDRGKFIVVRETATNTSGALYSYSRQTSQVQ